MKDLLQKAKEAMTQSYSPYSGVKVGAALLTKNGKIFLGTNVENAAFGPSCCAERSAIFSAVSQGEREFSAIAIVGGKDGKIADFFPPCGVCRQVMAEFCGADFPIYLENNRGEVKSLTLGELLPHAFTKEKF